MLRSRNSRREESLDAHAPEPIVGHTHGADPAALRGGDFEGLLAVLDPDVVVRADGAGARPDAPSEVRGAREWARRAIAFSQGARAARPALVNGEVGVVVAPRGRLLRVLSFTIARGKITRIEVVGDPARLQQLELAVLDD